MLSIQLSVLDSALVCEGTLGAVGWFAGCVGATAVEELVDAVVGFADVVTLVRVESVVGEAVKETRDEVVVGAAATVEVALAVIGST